MTPEELKDQRAASKVIGKGWSVSKSKGKKTPYFGYAKRDGKRVADDNGTPRWQTREEAVIYAICQANKHKTLDWAKTVRWLKLMRMNVSVDGLSMPDTQKRAKGWYMGQTRCRSNGRKYWQIIAGPSYREAVYWCIGLTPRSAFQRAIRMGLKDESWYNQVSSSLWFQRYGHDDCVDLA